MSKCKGCGAEIVWIKTKAGKAMPCDTNKVTIITDNGETVTGYTPHWATCPAARTFKKNSGELVEVPKGAVVLTPEERAEEMRLINEERKQAVKEFAEVKILIPSTMADKIDELVKEAYGEWERY